MAGPTKKIKIEKSYRESDEYKSLIDDCKSTLVEGISIIRTDVIILHGKIGERVTTDKLYKKYGKSNQEFIRQLAKDMQVSYQEIYRSVQFYEKFKIVSLDGEGWDRFKEGKNISWNKIKNDYLPERIKKEHVCEWETIERCRICRRIRPKDEIRATMIDSKRG